jgi:DNA invertase Pin-like site-specific DNA recombinase
MRLDAAHRQSPASPAARHGESGARSYRFQGNFSSLFLNRQAVTSAIYARVSSDGQDYEDQLAELRAFVQRQGWTCVEYLEKLSGKEGNTRPALEQLLRDAQNKRFDVVVVWKLDRFGRSTLDTLTNIKTLSAYGVRFLVSTQPAIDTDDRSPLGKFILQILASVAELERGFIIERTQTGFNSYRASYAAGRVGNTRHSKSGKDLPVGRPKKVFDRHKVLKMARDGASIRQIAKTLDLGRSVVHECLKKDRASGSK